MAKHRYEIKDISMDGHCTSCGHKEVDDPDRVNYWKEWKYCPYCGVPLLPVGFAWDKQSKPEGEV